MELLGQILDRGIIHFFASCGVVMGVFMVLLMLRRRHLTKDWLPDSLKSTLVLAALTVFAFSTLREAVDVHNGQPLVKAFTDYASWLLGVVVASWGVYRIGMLPWPR